VSKTYKIAIIGYGSQGRAWALNLADSGCHITVGLRNKSKSKKISHRDGVKSISSIADVVADAEIIVFAFPDHIQGRVFKKDIEPNLKPGAALVFLHGFAVHFGIIKPAADLDVLLLAPLGPGKAVRENYLAGDSLAWFWAIYQNPSGEAKRKLDFLIRSLKIRRDKMIKTTMADEAVGDIFGEQAVLCGGLSQLIIAGFNALTRSGLSPQKAYLEVCYQIDLIVDLIKNFGVIGMLDRVSFAARYGALRSGPRIIDRRAKAAMAKILAEIKSGKFAERLARIDERQAHSVQRRLKTLSNPSFEKAARKFSALRDKK
jgi:ketol-acid reductoisomerase